MVKITKKREKIKKKEKSEWKNIGTEIKIKMRCEKLVHTKSQGVNSRTS